MRVLALDLGCKSGWACTAPNEIERSGSVVLDRSGDSRLGVEARDAKRFDRWSMRLVELLDEHSPDHVVIEGPAPGSQKGRAGPVLLGFRAATLIVLERRQASYEEVPPTEWQKWARRNGWAKGTDENDALHIARWWIEQQITEAA